MAAAIGEGRSWAARASEGRRWAARAPRRRLQVGGPISGAPWPAKFPRRSTVSTVADGAVRKADVLLRARMLGHAVLLGALGMPTAPSLDAGRTACAAPAPLSTTGPNVLLIGDRCFCSARAAAPLLLSA